MRPGAFLTKSGQAWKLVAFAALMLVSTALIVAAVRLAAPAFVLLGGCVAAAAFAACIWRLRCPACHYPVFGKAITERHAWTWFTDIIALERCPSCGFPDCDLRWRE